LLPLSATDTALIGVPEVVVTWTVAEPTPAGGGGLGGGVETGGVVAAVLLGPPDPPPPQAATASNMAVKIPDQTHRPASRQAVAEPASGLRLRVNMTISPCLAAGFLLGLRRRWLRLRGESLHAAAVGVLWMM